MLIERKTEEIYFRDKILTATYFVIVHTKKSTLKMFVPVVSRVQGACTGTYLEKRSYKRASANIWLTSCGVGKKEFGFMLLPRSKTSRTEIPPTLNDSYPISC